MTARESLRTSPNLRRVSIALSRRSWLMGALLGGGTLCGRASSASGKHGVLSKSDTDEIAKVEALAGKAGIGPFRTSYTEHFIGLGDAPAAFRQSALDIAESLAKVFVGYFHSRGFKAELPQGRMTVISLKDAESYRALLLGVNPGEAEGGHYDLGTNRLVMFDFRPQQADLGAGAAWVNSFTLIHETTHLLCYNTGILSRQADVPDCVSEGLATFAELWRPKQRAALGAINDKRLTATWNRRTGVEPWIPLADLLKNDDRISDAKTQQLAYAESWVLVHFLLKKDAWLPRFRAYLEGLAGPPLNPAPGRIEYAEKQLGPLAALDKELQKYARSLLARL